jgi:hypothetical protein
MGSHFLFGDLKLKLCIKKKLKIKLTFWVRMTKTQKTFNENVFAFICHHSKAIFTTRSSKKSLMFSFILGRTLCCPSGELVTHPSCSDTLPYFWKKKKGVNAFLMIWDFIWSPMVFNFVFDPTSCSFKLLSQLQSKGCNNRQYKNTKRCNVSMPTPCQTFQLPPNQWKPGLRSRPMIQVAPQP